MCVIIEKKVGVEIPVEALVRGATRNPHGYGVMVADRGKIVTFKGLPGDPNDSVIKRGQLAAEEVAKILEECKDLPTQVHFRWATAGKKTLDNAHPFQILNEKDHGLELAMMHNGTFHDFKIEGADESDTAKFVKEVAIPLFVRYADYAANEDELMADKSLRRILATLTGQAGVLTFLTGTGKSMTINRINGKEWPFGWASNHTALIEEAGANSRVFSSDDWQNEYPSRSSSFGGSSRTTVGASSNLPAPWMPPETWKKQQDQADSKVKTQGDSIKEMIRLSPHSSKTGLPEPRVRLDSKDFMGTYELEDLVWLDVDDIRDMIFHCPEATAVILMDLIYKMFLDAKGKPVSNYGRGGNDVTVS